MGGAPTTAKPTMEAMDQVVPYTRTDVDRIQTAVWWLPSDVPHNEGTIELQGEIHLSQCLIPSAHMVDYDLFVSILFLSTTVVHLVYQPFG